MTRMWMADPARMCRRHLLGEHKELHQLVGAINKKRMACILGHAVRGQIETRLIGERHDQLAREMEARGYNHRSPLPPHEPIDEGRVNRTAALADLLGRCPACRELHGEEEGRR